MVAGVALLALAVWPNGAVAQTCVAPPGTSAVDQYCESIPTAGGSRGPSDPGGPGERDGETGGALPGRPRRALERAGADGKSILGLTRATGTAPGERSGATAGASNDARDTANNPLSAIKTAVDTGMSTGQVFVWTLIGLALLIAGSGWMRFRRRQISE